MTCKHEHIQTWRFEDGQPAMWSCFDCAAKFEPIKGWMDQVERKDALLRQALCALGEGDCLLNHEAQKALVVEILKELQ
jgi:hypothetical protein